MPENVLHYPSSQRPVAVALVMHGLNTKPSIMTALVQVLRNLNIEVFLLQLWGHYGKTDINEVAEKLWDQEALGAYAMAKNASALKDIPLYFLGYSFGALLGQWLVQHEEVTFTKTVLIAPALILHTRMILLKGLFAFGNNLAIPAFTPKIFRANKFLPLHIYNILFLKQQYLAEQEFSKLNGQTLIFIDPKDELVSYPKLIKLITRFKLTNHKVIKLNSFMSDRSSRYHHLVIDEQTMGRENWQLFTRELAQFLELPGQNSQLP